jgi:hypothetical protein
VTMQDRAQREWMHAREVFVQLESERDEARAAVAAERERCARVCGERAEWCRSCAERDESTDTRARCREGEWVARQCAADILALPVASEPAAPAPAVRVGRWKDYGLEWECNCPRILPRHDPSVSSCPDCGTVRPPKEQP